MISCWSWEKGKVIALGEVGVLPIPENFGTAAKMDMVHAGLIFRGRTTQKNKFGNYITARVITKRKIKFNQKQHKCLPDT